MNNTYETSKLETIYRTLCRHALNENDTIVSIVEERVLPTPGNMLAVLEMADLIYEFLTETNATELAFVCAGKGNEL